MEIATNQFRQAMVVRLFRLWVMTREDGAVGFGRMHQVASEMRLPDEAAFACASLFQLIEAELGRPLVRECCCARTFSPDEVALLGVIEAAPSLSLLSGSQEVPHGLPGAIRWAAMAVRHALDWPDRQQTPRRRPATCPFIEGGNSDSAKDTRHAV